MEKKRPWAKGLLKTNEIGLKLHVLNLNIEFRFDQ